MVGNLVKRWKNNEGKEKLKVIIKYLKAGIPLDDLPGLEKFEGKWDLRGINLTPEFLLKEIGVSKSFLNKGKLLFQNKTLKDVDLSSSNISFLQLQECDVRDCKFGNITGKELNIIASNFTNCNFTNSNLSYSFLNQNVGPNSGSFINVDFISSNLSESTFYFPQIEFCKFVNCKLTATNFDGSRFKNTKFLGDVDSCWFSSFSNFAHKSTFYLFNKIDPTNYPNQMENVDFSEAKLTGVSFRNRVPLDKCKFPLSENYIFIKNASKIFDLARSYFELNWNEEDRRIALHMINNVYRSNNYFDQEEIFLDKFILIDLFGSEFANMFFKVLAVVNK